MKTKKPHILVVDDTHIARMTVDFMLNNLGYETSETFNGTCALEMLKSEKTKKVDAIILDCIMPKICGIKVLEKIHAIPKFRGIPIIMLTVHAEREHIKTAATYDILNVLFKPVDKAFLGKVLKKVFE